MACPHVCINKEAAEYEVEYHLFCKVWIGEWLGFFSVHVWPKVAETAWGGMLYHCFSIVFHQKKLQAEGEKKGQQVQESNLPRSIQKADACTKEGSRRPP